MRLIAVAGTWTFKAGVVEERAWRAIGECLRRRGVSKSDLMRLAFYEIAAELGGDDAVYASAQASRIRYAVKKCLEEAGVYDAEPRRYEGGPL